MVEGAMPTPLLEPRKLDLVDGVLQELKEFYSRSGMERTLAIGELLLTRFFEGSPAVWKSRRRNKNNSIRRLAARKDCPLRRSALNDAIAVFVTISAAPSVRTYGHVGASHVAAVATLRDDQRADLLHAAETQRWTVRRLKQEIVALRRQHGDHRGRPRLPDERKSLTALLSAVARLERSLDALERDDLTAAMREKASELARRLRLVAAALESRASRAFPAPALGSDGAGPEPQRAPL
jgi:hypothetical protein